MRAFAYVRPDTIEEVLGLLQEHGPEAALLAGGTDLLVQIRRGKKLPRLVIDVKRVQALHGGIAERAGCLRVGALTVMTEITNDARIQQHFPALVEAASVVGSIQIRNRATLTGNICNASPAADTAPALLVYNAVVNIIGPEGQRSVPLADFFLGPGQTELQRGEMVASIDLPLPEPPQGAAFGRMTRRRGVDLATINLCCHVDAAGETRFAYGAAGPRPFVVRDASGILSSGTASPEEKEEALRSLVEQARPISDVRGSQEYRLVMLLVQSRRTLESALARRAGAAAEA